MAVAFQNKSTDAQTYLWDFGDGSTSTEEEPIHVYQSFNDNIVTLIAINGTCADTTSSTLTTTISLSEDSIPNVFTPNNDGINDCFDLDVPEELNECYQIHIFNRWGNIVYESADPADCWKGGSDKILPAGIYVYTVNVKDLKWKGTVQLIR